MGELQEMSRYIRKAHNVSVLLYHYVCPTKYRRVVFDVQKVVEILLEACEEITVQYSINFIEIGEDMDHVHFLIQAVPKYSPAQIINIVKSRTAKKIFKLCPEVKKKLWGGNFWSERLFRKYGWQRSR